jgi:protein-disulfide isomerase
MDFVGQLKTKYKVVFPKNVNAPDLKPADVLATVTPAGGKQITAREFEEKAGLNLWDAQMEIYEQAADAVGQLVYTALVAAEAKTLGIGSNDLIAREISDKMKDFSDEERFQLEAALQKRLFAKYNARVLLKEPAAFVQKVSADDDPARGSAAAPVTVVMFTDFQCPACAATHPVLQKVLAEYGMDKVRFVVRDFPLMQIHPNAFKAAQAAAAANAQGKFFEYSELLYKNQNSLDTASLKRFAQDVRLNQKQFDADLDSEKFAAEVRKDLADGASYGITSTPTIFVNGVKVRHLSAQAFREAIEKALRK